MKKKSLLWVLPALGAGLGFCKGDWDFTPDRFTEQDYSHIMDTNIRRRGRNPRVVDIAMLGAHDALSDGIGAKSPPDPNSPDVAILSNPLAAFIGGGLVARLSRAQKSRAYDLARRGVRFFDVRCTYADGQWHTLHGLLSRPLEDCLRELIRFMDETRGEVLVLSFHQVFGASAEALLEWLPTVRERGKSLFDFVRYDAGAIPLGELRYNDVAKDGSGAVLLLEPGEKCYSKEQLYGLWHDTNDPDALLRGVERENAMLKEEMGGRGDCFRWSQSQLTPQLSWPAVLRAAPDWSLLMMAHRFNHRLLERMSEWLPQIPVISVDYADDMNRGFNDRAVEIINGYNRDGAPHNHPGLRATPPRRGMGD